MSDKTSCGQILADILDAIANLPCDPSQLRGSNYPFLSMLNLGDGQVLFITSEIRQMLVSFYRAVMDVFFQGYKSEFTDSDWNRMVKQSFETVLAGRDPAKCSEEDAEGILKEIRDKIHDRISALHECEYVFGCHFCNIPDFEPLSIGSVRFEPKHSWLAKIRNEGSVSKNSRSRDDSRDLEQRILDVTSDGHFVSSVTVGPTGEDAGLRKALVAARLAMTAVVLAFDKPSSALEAMGLTYDRQPYLQRYLVFYSDEQFGWGTSRSGRSGGISRLNAEKWEELRSDFDRVFNSAGEAIRYVTHGRNKVLRPKIMQALSQALLWFHEGCKEDVDTMAIVKFCSSMEALVAQGENGILDWIRDNLSVDDDHILRKDMNRLYGTGRSQTLHGPNDKLGHDWSSDRNISESLARLCLITCLERTTEHQGSVDDPKLFLQPEVSA